MDHDDMILAEIRALRDELREYVRITHENANDIKWMKGSIRIGGALIAAAVSTVVSFVLKYVIK